MSSSQLDFVPLDNDSNDGNDAQQDKDTNPGLRLALDLRGALAAHDDDTDSASQQSISFASSPAASPHDSPKFPVFSINDTLPRRSHSHTISTESSDDPDDSNSGHLSGHTSSAASHGEHSLGEQAKQVPPTPLTAALQNNVYPPLSPRRSSVASFATSTSSYSRKARPESLLIDPSNGPLALGIALVDFNHQVRSYYSVVVHRNSVPNRLAHG
jgi:hypothetical protein